jgi:GT2 family glycosyltransferase
VVSDAPGTPLESTPASAGIVFTGGNAGFAGACNLGAECAQSASILFANDDLEFSSPFISALADALEGNPALAAVIPPIRTTSASGGALDESRTSLRFRLGLFYPVAGKGSPGRVQESGPTTLKWVTAACVLVRREAFESVGGFDPAYAPAYCEDLDLSFRLRLAGWTVGRVVTPQVFHRRGETTTRFGASALCHLFLRNLLIFHFKFFRAGPLAWGFKGGLQARMLSPNRRVWRSARDQAITALKASPMQPPVVSGNQLSRLVSTTR